MSMSIVVEQLDEETDEVLEDISTEELTSVEVSDVLEDDIQGVPDKFKGKELTDVIDAYTNLEKELGRKNNEVGELRKLTDDFIKQELEPTEKKENQKIDLDDLLEDPDAVIQKALDNNPKVAELERQLKHARVEDARKSFEAQHKDWEDVMGSTDFQSWITESPVRANMFTNAHKNYEYDVADELLNLYKGVRGVAKAEAEKTASSNRNKALKATTVEKGSAPEKSKPVYRRADLIRLKQTNPEKYKSMEPEIYLAYQEKRVR